MAAYARDYDAREGMVPLEELRPGELADMMTWMDDPSTEPLGGMTSLFAGHIAASTPILRAWEPGAMGPGIRAMVSLELEPGKSLCVVDLLHPSEAKTMRCLDPLCRCNLASPGAETV
jgi:hypothetical protein